MLADFLDMESSLIVNLHIQSVDQVSAIKTIKRKITDLDRAKSRNKRKRSAAAMTWTSSPPTLPLTGRRRKSSCRLAEPQRADVPFDLPGPQHR